MRQTFMMFALMISTATVAVPTDALALGFRSTANNTHQASGSSASSSQQQRRPGLIRQAFGVLRRTVSVAANRLGHLRNERRAQHEMARANELHTQANTLFENHVNAMNSPTRVDPSERITRAEQNISGARNSASWFARTFRTTRAGRAASKVIRQSRREIRDARRQLSNERAMAQTINNLDARVEQHAANAHDYTVRARANNIAAIRGARALDEAVLRMFGIDPETYFAARNAQSAGPAVNTNTQLALPAHPQQLALPAAQQMLALPPHVNQPGTQLELPFPE